MRYTKYLMMDAKSAELPQPKISRPDLSTALNEAVRLSDSHSYDAALVQYEALIGQFSDVKDTPILAYLHYQRGISLKKLALLTDGQANLVKAAAAFESAAQLYSHPQNLLGLAQAQAGLGSVWANLSEYQSKSQHLAKAMQFLEETITTLEKGVKAFNSKQHPQDYALLELISAMTHNALAEYKDKGTHLTLAVAAGEEAMAVFSRSDYPSLHALSQFNLGYAHHVLAELNDPAENRERAYGAYQAALEIYNSDEYPFEYAHTHNCLANLYIDRAAAANREEDLNQAINSCKEVLNVLNSVNQYPLSYSYILHNLGSACKLFARIRGGGQYLEKARQYFQEILRIENLPPASEILGSTYLNLGVILQQSAEGAERHLPEAVGMYEKALTIYTAADFPRQYAITQSNFGSACLALADFDARRNWLFRAVQAFTEATRTFTVAAAPQDHAASQVKLGDAYIELAREDYQKEYPTAAIAAYEAALKIFRPESHRSAHVHAAIQLGKACKFLAEHEPSTATLNKTLQVYENTLRLLNPSVQRVEYAETLARLGEAYYSFAEFGTKEINLTRALKCFQDSVKLYGNEYPSEYAYFNVELGLAALGLAELQPKTHYPGVAVRALNEALNFYSYEKNPERFAAIQNAIGRAHLIWATVENRQENLEKALAAFSAALKCYNPDRFPVEFGTNMNYLGSTCKAMAEEMQSMNYKSLDEYKKYKMERIFNAISVFQGALTIFTVDHYPEQYAQTQTNLGEVFALLAMLQEPQENLARAISALESALLVYTPENYPAQYRKVMNHLERLRQQL